MTDLSKHNKDKQASISEQQPQDQLIRIEKVQELLGIGRTSVYDLIRSNKLDAPLKVGRSSLWSLNSINTFIQNLKMEGVA